LNWKKAVLEYNFKPDEGVCLYVLNLAGKHGDTKLAGDVIRVLGEEGYTYRLCHFSPLIEAFASTGDIASTFQVFTAMRKVGVIPNKKTALPIAYQLGRDKNAIKKARDIIEKMAKTNGQEVDISAFNLIIHAFAFNKEYDEAISLYARAKEFGVEPNSETLDATLDACIHCKDAELGQVIYQEQLSRGVKATESTLSKMVTLMCTQEDYEDAFKYLEKMKRSNLIPLRGCYFKLVKTLSAANDPRLEMAIDDMRAYGYNLSNHMEEYMEDEVEKRLNLVAEEEMPTKTTTTML
jgi:pentatricopeptide repeat protein